MFFYFFLLFFPIEPNERMQVEEGKDGASAGRGEGGADDPAAHAPPSQHAAAPARRGGVARSGVEHFGGGKRAKVGMAATPECQDAALLAKQVRIVSVDVCGF